MGFILLDQSFNQLAIVDNYDSLIWTERYAKAGDFEIYLGSSKAAFETYKEDYYLWSSDSQRLMIVEDIESKYDRETGSFMPITGRSFESILDRRIVWGQVIISGNMQTELKKLFDQNILSPNDATRKIPNLTFKMSTDPLVTGITVEAQYLGNTMYDVVTSLCDMAGLGFKITMPTDGQFVFELYAGADRTYNQTKLNTVVFSPNFDNLGQSNYLRSKKVFKTVALIGGEGQGGDKKFAMKVASGGALSGLNRRELYVDASGVSSNNNGQTVPADVYQKELLQKGEEGLAEHRIKMAFDGQIEMTESFQYENHFFMGDLVQMENEYGASGVSRVVEFIRAISSSGIKNYPTLEAIDS